MAETMQKIPSIFELPLPVNMTNVFQKHTLVDEIEEIEAQNLIMKGVWSLKEDEALTKAVKQAREPISWDLISKQVKGRSPKQCRERWLFRLSPDVKKSPFQQWEDELIVLKRQMIGNHWSAIAQLLPGRTSCAVKNRWYTVLRNRVQNIDPCKQNIQSAQGQSVPSIYGYQGYHVFV